MRRSFVPLAVATVLALLVLAQPAVGRDRPNSTATLKAMKLAPAALDPGAAGVTGGGNFSVNRISEFRCESAGDPTTWVDISCNDETYGQDWAPDNEIAIAVDPEDPDHLLAGSNDYFYRFNNSSGARQAIIPTGFFTSFDGGENWIDGQVPIHSGNGAGDPAPAFDAKHDVALMAQLENQGGQGGPWVTQGDVAVARSLDGGVTWEEPVTVFQGRGADPAAQQIFYDKEWIAVDNFPDSPFYGRIYVTVTQFLQQRQAYAESGIFLSWSDDGGVTWTRPKEISGSHPSCTYQETGDGTECDEDQDSIPVVASDGTLYIHFMNYQNAAAWEVDFDFDGQVMVQRSTDGGETFDGPFVGAQLEDGLSDTPYSIIGRQTVWGHQIRWNSWGNITVDPNDPAHLAIVFADRDAPNPNATDECIFEAPGEPPDYDPCEAKTDFDTDVRLIESFDGGETWTAPAAIAPVAGPEWFPWADFAPDGSLAVAWDEDTQVAPADTFVHVLWTEGDGKEVLGPLEHPDVSVTHWAGQYVPQDQWPVSCGPEGYTDPPVEDAEGKDCNQFHGDYTGLDVGSDGRIHVVWTGLNRFETSPQVDFYTGEPHDGYAQDAMYARR